MAETRADPRAEPRVAAAVRAYVKLLRASHAVRVQVEHSLSEDCLTLTQLGVLEALLHLGPMSQRELGGKVLTSAGNMTDLLGKLQARGLVCRLRVPGDRRAVRVELTAAGRDLITALFPRHAHDIATAMGGLSAEELASLDHLLRKLGHAAADAAPLAPAGAPP